MNFLAKTLGSLTGSSIPYNIGDKIVSSAGTDFSSNSIWNVYLGTKKEDNSPCTVFEFDLQNPATAKYAPLAKNALKKIRSMKLPYVLNTLDTFETEYTLYIVTERVQPLLVTDKLTEQARLLGVFQISTALKFINLEGGSVHGNVCSSSVFVTDSGEWRLGGFELTTSYKSDDFNIFNMAYQLPSFSNGLASPEFTNQGAGMLSSMGRHVIKFDAFKLGVFIYELFTGNKVTEITQMNNMTKLPRAMGAHVKKLVNQSVNVRYSAEQFLKAGETSFFNTPLISAYKDLNEMSFKEENEKLAFLDTLESIEDDCPPGFIEFKLLPELIKQFFFDKAETSNQAVLLYHILKLATKLSQESYVRIVKPVVLKSFTLPDRAVRMTLLTSLPRYIDSFTNYEVSDKIFSNLVTGFSDTSATIREETVKAVLPIADKLSDRQLNNELLRYLAKAQNDEKPEIRTNTVICLGKIAGLLNNTSRPGVLITAFTKTLKDPFVPARISAVMAFASCIDYFSPEICCSRVLSAVAPALLDKSSKVRMEAQVVFESYLAKIKDAASTLPEDKPDEMESQAQEQQNIQDNMGTFTLGWGALSKISDKIGGKLADIPDDTRESTPDILKPQPTVQPPTVKMSGLQISDDFLDNDDDGWSFDIDDEPKPKPKPVKTVPLKASAASKPARTPVKTSGLQLKPTNKLKLDLDVDEEDGWGEGW